MTIQLDIRKSASIASDGFPSVKVCDLCADGEEMPFVNALVANVQEFAKNWINGKRE